jgi:hypothetical protein
MFLLASFNVFTSSLGSSLKNFIKDLLDNLKGSEGSASSNTPVGVDVSAERDGFQKRINELNEKYRKLNKIAKDAEDLGVKPTWRDKIAEHPVLTACLIVVAAGGAFYFISNASSGI